MFVERLGEDENVVKVDDDHTLMDKVTEEFVHHGLERCGRIGETEEHDGRFEEAHIGAECGLPFVALLNAHMVVTPADIQLRKVTSTLKPTLAVCCFALVTTNSLYCCRFKRDKRLCSFVTKLHDKQPW